MTFVYTALAIWGVAVAAGCGLLFCDRRQSCPAYPAGWLPGLAMLSGFVPVLLVTLFLLFYLGFVAGIACDVLREGATRGASSWRSKTWQTP